MPFGEYCLSSLFVILFVSRCRGDCGSAKNTGMPVSIRNRAQASISLPQSQVTERASCPGNVDVVFARAFFIVFAPQPANAGSVSGVSLCQ